MRVRVVFEIEPFPGVSDDDVIDSLKRSIFYMPGNSSYWIDRNKTSVERIAMAHRRFVLQRDEDVTGVSGTGVVAEGIEFSDGVVTLHWISQWPSSIVHYDQGMESVEHVHGHSGSTRIVWLDEKD